MRRYRIASWILFILSIIDFTLVAPVDVRDIHGVGVNVVDVAKYRIAALQKRMDPDEDHSSVTSEHGEPYHGGPGPELESDSDLDLDSELDSGSDSSSESDSDWDSELGSGSDSSSDSDDSDGGEAAEQWEAELQNYELFDIEEDQEEDLDSSDEEESDHEQSPPHSPEHDEDFPHSPESQHPAASTYEDLWRKLLKGSLRPRTSTFRGCGCAKEGVAGNR